MAYDDEPRTLRMEYRLSDGTIGPVGTTTDDQPLLESTSFGYNVAREQVIEFLARSTSNRFIIIDQEREVAL